MRLRFLLVVRLAGLRKLLFGFVRFPESSKYDAEAVVRPCGIWFERNRTLQLVLSFRVLPFSRQDRPQFEQRGCVILMLTSEVAEEPYGFLVFAQGIVGQCQVITSGNLIRLDREALLQEGLRLGIVSFEVIHSSHGI